MKRKDWIIIFLCVAIWVAFAVLFLRQDGTERPGVETGMRPRLEQNNLTFRKTFQIFQPDTTSDIRFGRSTKSPSPTP
jgi:hypothetical protein